MSTESGPKISALLTLHCRNNHFLGKLVTHLPRATIRYVDPAGLVRPWTDQFRYGFFSLPVCPGGCEYEVAETLDKLHAKLKELAADPERYQDTYALTFLQPAREAG
ncbi:MAG TPA: hypothetical protein VKI00_07815 [Mycobacterium sp.]|uniref:hypothetical protein n=1 Tax=Mycobacterium sp. TaxID=1785 RepID=UPI002C9FA3BB|nr:hypothetical protein [Mycobacterium sp.]HME75555.1 hypothetical protein [Mycobacterium sp.]